MLLSIGLILIVSLSLNAIFIKLKLPGLIAFIITGIVLGPFVLDLIDPKLLSISADLREIALIVILLRAGLTLDLNDLKKVGRPAILLSFIPATIEILFIGFISPLLFGISSIEGFILGSIVAAVSPAVVVPRMIHFIEKKIGTDKQIPQMILAGSSIDDIYCIVMFTIFVGIQQTNTFDTLSIVLFPVSIIISLLLGIAVGLIIIKVFKKIHMRDTIKVLIIFALAFFFIVLEDALKDYFTISGLLAVIAMAGSILKVYPVLAKRLTGKFSKIWVAAEIMLFVLVGAAVEITVLKTAGLLAVGLIAASLIFRMISVIICISKTNLNSKERIFACIAYLPKATVQAAIGAIPLTLGMPAGSLILTISVLSIFISAPLGAIGMDRLNTKLLKVNNA
ncbi:cation:proton antiporter [Candidatus Izemoplasma sp. B36]|uniref:cation:proton antiporter n=1 Tax=Candidatus Izemoplasma sp. B36 TaxID=3242468 RepID=UPI003556CB3D